MKKVQKKFDVAEIGHKLDRIRCERIEGERKWEKYLQSVGEEKGNMWVSDGDRCAG